MNIAFISQLKPSELVTYVIVLIIYWDTHSRLHTRTQLCSQQSCRGMPRDDPLSTHSTVVHWTTQVSRPNQQQHRHTRWVVSQEMFSPSHMEVSQLDLVEESNNTIQTNKIIIHVYTLQYMCTHYSKRVHITITIHVVVRTVDALNKLMI